jgi:hypothetical protein
VRPPQRHGSLLLCLLLHPSRPPAHAVVGSYRQRGTYRFACTCTCSAQRLRLRIC